LEGMPRHASTHAAGVVITREPVSFYVPLSKNDEAVVTQFTMTTLEELGLLKMDFLGLRNLTVIQDAGKMIRRKYDPAFKIEDIPIDDQKVFDLLWSGKTEGIFQFESSGMRQVLMNLRPESMEDLIAVISLYRPGPMESIPKYIENRHHPEKITYRHPLLEGILKVTYGCIVYQEQVMEIVRRLAGYSYGRADLVRRAMSKKKAGVMEKEREYFIHGLRRPDGSLECAGAVANGVDEQTANAIFDEMAGFASYAFNKSHAAAYALVAYQTAWLKSRYPKEYMAALLTSVLDSSDKVSEYISECGRLGICILPPDVNESDEGFTVSGSNIRFGLLAVKNLGRGLIRALEHQREQGPYQNFTDFVKRMQGLELNRRALESLIKCGAFDSMGYTRRQLMMHFESLLSQLEAQQKRNLEGQINLFDSADESGGTGGEFIEHEDEFNLPELLRQEKEMIGFYLTGHPLAEYDEYRKKNSIPQIRDITGEGSRFVDGDDVSLLGIVQSKLLKSTRSGGLMAFITLDDGSGSIELVVFPKVLELFGSRLVSEQIVHVSGRVSQREEEAPKLICNAVKSASELAGAQAAAAKGAGRPGLYLRLSSSGCAERERVNRLVAVFDGDFPLFFYFEDSRKYLLAPRAQWVSVNDVLLGELREILGDKNVIVQE
ncbi:MAG: DNA polymerase III subunit alpha, partial [Clostridia bacterium]|nr:DNA polymerase III subunit alpha [Clostridia bacterium]